MPNPHPRGEPRWPEFRDAVPGRTRVRHVRSGLVGTFVRWPRKHPRRTNPGYAVVLWDAHPAWPRPVCGQVVAYAFDLELE